jgi:hypothetical protein
LARLADELGSVFETRRTARDEELLDHGVVTTEVRGSIRRAALKQVVVPCLGALIQHVGGLRTGAFSENKGLRAP